MGFQQSGVDTRIVRRLDLYAPESAAAPTKTITIGTADWNARIMRAGQRSMRVQKREQHRAFLPRHVDDAPLWFLRLAAVPEDGFEQAAGASIV